MHIRTSAALALALLWPTLGHAEVSGLAGFWIRPAEWSSHGSRQTLRIEEDGTYVLTTTYPGKWSVGADGILSLSPDDGRSACAYAMAENKLTLAPQENHDLPSWSGVCGSSDDYKRVEATEAAPIGLWKVERNESSVETTLKIEKEGLLTVVVTARGEWKSDSKNTFFIQNSYYPSSSDTCHFTIQDKRLNLADCWMSGDFDRVMANAIEIGVRQ